MAEDERCMVCNKSDDAENLVLCDGCDKPYHAYCFSGCECCKKKPSLFGKTVQIPEGDWFCKHCNGHIPESSEKNTRLYAWGANRSAQLGLEHNKPDRIFTPTLVEAVSSLSLVKVAPCYESTAVLTIEGTIYTVGDGCEGKLGHNDVVHERLMKFRRVETLMPENVSKGEGRIVELVGGKDCHFAISEQGHGYSWGSGEYGKIGHQDHGVKKTPKKISALREMEIPVQYAACGQDHCMLLTPEGEILVCGGNYKGQIGNGTYDNKWVPIMLNPTKMNEGHLATGSARPILTPDIVSIAAGACHSLAITRSGAAYSWGFGNSGQLGVPKPPADPSKPSFLQPKFQLPSPTLIECLNKVKIKLAYAGDNHTLLFSKDNQIYAFGDNSYGQCGLNSTDKNIDEPQLIDALESEVVQSVVAGSNHTLVLTEEGDCYSFGDNMWGQCGLGEGKDKIIVPTLIRGDLPKLGYISANGNVSFGICLESIEKRKKELKKRPPPEVNKEEEKRGKKKK